MWSSQQQFFSELHSPGLHSHYTNERPKYSYYYGRGYSIELNFEQTGFDKKVEEKKEREKKDRRGAKNKARSIKLWKGGNLKCIDPLTESGNAKYPPLYYLLLPIIIYYLDS